MSQEAMKLALEALLINCGGNTEGKGKEAITALREALAQQPAPMIRGDIRDGLVDDEPAQPQQEPEFFTHNVEHPYDWSEWVCPDPKSYLMKCCDCGLVHEAEFGVVRYKSETEREDCDMVDDPNLQAVFRMRRSEQWSPVDTAHRAGGLPMEQPAQQEPVAWGWAIMHSDGTHAWIRPRIADFFGSIQEREPYTSEDAKHADREWAGLAPHTIVTLYTSPQPQRTWVGLTEQEAAECWSTSTVRTWQAIEAKLKEKNTC